MVRTQILKVAFIIVVLGTAACRPDTAGPPEFDGMRAFGYLEAQVEMGPRVPGTVEHDRTRDWIAGELGRLTPHVSLQPFTGDIGGMEVEMHNILCSLYPENPSRVLLCAHWDCRPWADRDDNPSNHDRPVPGANDGASGVAVLLEIAALVADREPAVGVDIVFFDGEDAGAYSQNDTWLLGSRHFARVMPAEYRPRYAILLDMIGDRDLELSRDYQSSVAAPALWNRVLEECARQEIPVARETVGIIDDHIPLIERGIPAVDLIDFDYPSWHTIADTPDKCSAESLGKIGRLVMNLLYEER